MAPPPAGPIIGGIFTVASSLMTIFSPPEEEAEELTLNEIG